LIQRKRKANGGNEKRFTSVFARSSQRKTSGRGIEWHYLLHPVPKAGGIAQNPFYFYFFYLAPVLIPPAEFFAQMNAAHGNVSLYLKIDIYAHRGTNFRYSENTSWFEGRRTFAFFFYHVSGFTRRNLSTSRDIS